MTIVSDYLHPFYFLWFSDESRLGWRFWVTHGNRSEVSDYILTKVLGNIEDAPLNNSEHTNRGIRQYTSGTWINVKTNPPPW